MASLEEIRAERLKKLELLKEKGMLPYPIATKRSHSIADALSSFAKFSRDNKRMTLAGRVMAIRGQGALVFFNIQDGEATIQGFLKRDEMDETLFALFQDAIDIGDFVECTGTLFMTKRKERTMQVKEWKILSKSLRPLPDKWHGLQDVEERFRKRYLDLLMSEEVRARFKLRSKIITSLRTILNDADYMEVETPLLQSLAGGALAEPFKTHHNALDIDLNLRIAPELYLKKLLVGGFPRVYEIGRNFRNEGIDMTHNPEFTMLEFYASYETCASQMEFVEKLVKTLVKNVLKVSKIKSGEDTIDVSKKFAVASFLDLFKRYASIESPEAMSREDWRLASERFGVKVEAHDSIEKIMDNIYKKACRPKMIQPTFIINYPAGFSPFAKKQEKDPSLIDRFQLVIAGIEVVNAFSELNDPLEQKARYEEQDIKKKGGEGDVSPSDEDYLEAIEYGLPPAGGVGIGIDRVAMILSDTRNIREVVLFPTMRPEQG
ncbi:MAG: Lysine-tRNA ligase [Parcubacteria group bacterium GW2011_GWA1_44_13]|uniref:Lysine--tRNA ligase n=1 Tax=Candidatus Nomurabacteria bacterium GW2011_GWB1_44_12 TaxID=1618748 RepID=A0A837I6U7_9BACT|nr:MAG: Lysine-tRNA ligase [Candidatus Nomurabacteria bacterium GW2011_GWD1_44_10]KKT36567.1 MAG: Lysine-tRNA ligase [Candidatus Nomurabacteria bacterium GW2011_GWB1_44_12]KKT38193.1 MAG: Lysine-tRNA ligase [Parcubacteria group bacterium GW2011_GWA1_44_13]KKT59588.1 MAG: Lysine-tRNA ligase [Parcubacteria group bacterium GW2011_GWC1_44_26]HBB44246.1 lysine--tRNA ligase [Candidatus Yonathbacteria bacterium]